MQGHGLSLVADYAGMNRSEQRKLGPLVPLLEPAFSPLISTALTNKPTDQGRTDGRGTRPLPASVGLIARKITRRALVVPMF